MIFSASILSSSPSAWVWNPEGLWWTGTISHTESRILRHCSIQIWHQRLVKTAISKFDGLLSLLHQDLEWGLSTILVISESKRYCSSSGSLAAWPTLSWNELSCYVLPQLLEVPLAHKHMLYMHDAIEVVTLSPKDHSFVQLASCLLSSLPSHWFSTSDYEHRTETLL